MSIRKKGTLDTSIVVSSSVYACSSCDHTEIDQGDFSQEKKCPKCDSPMNMISASTEIG